MNAMSNYAGHSAAELETGIRAVEDYLLKLKLLGESDRSWQAALEDRRYALQQRKS